MPAALAVIADGHVLGSAGLHGWGPAPPTSFENCGFRSRETPGFDGLPCRGDEEESCNEVHATCAREPKQGFKIDPDDSNFLRPQPPCALSKERPLTRARRSGRGARGSGASLRGAGSRKGSVFGRLAAKLSSLTASTGWGGDCNSRMVDMPYGLRNPEADSHGKSLRSFLFSNQKAANQELPLTVWGLAVHGLSGTFAFDSHGPHAGDYVYELPQPGGHPSDFYVCDSAIRPQACALLGGNLQHACAENYDAQQCDFCEDHGTSLVCSIRGWNPKYRKWSRVPIYPRDLLGELYRGEWRDVFARPMWASVTLQKSSLRHVKRLPPSMVGPGPALKAVRKPRLTDPPSVLNVLASFNPLLPPPEPSRPCAAEARRPSASPALRRGASRPRAAAQGRRGAHAGGSFL